MEGIEAYLFIMMGESIFLVSHCRVVGVISLLLYAEPVYGPSDQSHGHQHSHYYQDYHEYAEAAAAPVVRGIIALLDAVERVKALDEGSPFSGLAADGLGKHSRGCHRNKTSLITVGAACEVYG